MLELASSDVIGSNGKAYALDRFGWVPARLDYDGWGDVRVEVGAIVEDEIMWRVMAVDPVGNYVGLWPAGRIHA